MSVIIEYLPFIIPLAIINIALIIFALVDLLRKKRVRYLNIGIWIIIILLLDIIGPVLYFAVGKDEN